MLTYKYRIRPEIKKEMIAFSGIFVSNDCTYITGCTSPDYRLMDGDQVIVNTINAIDTYSAEVHVEYAKRNGTAVTYDLYEVKSGLVPVNEGSVSVEYIEYDGKFVYRKEGGFSVDSGHTFSDAVDGIVGLWTEHPIDDGEFTVDGREFLVENTPLYSDDENGQVEYGEPTVIDKISMEVVTEINGKPITINGYHNDGGEKVAKFRISRRPSEEFPVEYVSCARYELYANVGGEEYPVSAFYGDGDGGSTVCVGIGADIGGVRYLISGYTAVDGVVYDGNRVVDEHSVPSIPFLVREDRADESTIPVHTRIESVPFGSRLLLFAGDEAETVTIGDVIMMRRRGWLATELDVVGGEYVVYGGTKYMVMEHVGDAVSIEGTDYAIEYTDGTFENAVVEVLGEEIPLSVNQEEGKARRMTLRMERDNDDDLVYREQQNEYKATFRKGIIIDGERYPVVDTVHTVPSSEGYDDVRKQSVIVGKNELLYFKVTDVFGGNMIVCKPILDGVYNDENTVMRSICDRVNAHSSDYDIRLVDDIFGGVPMTYRTALDIATEYGRSWDNIYDSGQVLMFPQFIALHKIIDNTAISVPLSQNTALNLQQDSDIDSSVAYNSIVDIERDLYVPKYKDEDRFKSVTSVRYNLHFRTRDLETGKVYDDMGWFVTDYDQYKSIGTFDKDKLQSTGDLLGLIGFTNGDVFYQKKKLAKSFIRISFYNGTNPNTQTLLHTSVMFADEHWAYSKYIKSVGVIKYRSIGANEVDIYDTDTPSVFAEPLIPGNTGLFSFDDEHRICCSFRVSSKSDTVDSSEGFYAYIFKEFCKGLHDVTVYMKVEFNHAGIGMTIPMVMPVADGHVLQISSDEDVEKMENGVPIKKVNEASYIPVHLTYDKKSNEFIYYFDSPYKEAICPENNGTFTFNLFELKIKDPT